MTILHHQFEKTVDQAGNDRFVVQQVIVVHDEQEIVLDLIVDLIGEEDEDCFGVLFDGLQLTQAGAGGRPDARKTLGQRGDQIGDKALRIAVKEVERQPADGHVRVMSQINQKGGLAVPRRRRQEDEFVVEQSLQVFQQPRTGEQFRAAVGNDDLGFADGYGFDRHCLGQTFVYFT